jgi:putative membrane protein
MVGQPEGNPVDAIRARRSRGNSRRSRISQSLFLSPANSGKRIWGVGPALSLPTATATPLGSGKFSIGPTGVALVTPKPWVVGMLARQLWSVAGPSDRSNVSQLLLQPFVNYNLPEGWYLTNSPIITANWNATSGNGGISRSAAESVRSSRSVTSRSMSGFRRSITCSRQAVDPGGHCDSKFNFAWVRTRLSLKRTMMSWLRTAVALIGFGFALVQYLNHLQQIPGARSAYLPTAPEFLGLALISCGVLALVISIWQYWWTVRYMWGEPFAPLAGLTKEGMQSPVLAVAILLIFIGLFAFGAVLWRLT